MGFLTTLAVSVANERPKRGIFGKIALWWFYIWNLIMWLVVFFGLYESLQNMEGLQCTNLAKYWVAMVFAVLYTLLVWMFGTVIFGIIAFLTRPKWPRRKSRTDNSIIG